MPIIEVKNLGKKYNISHRQGGYVALRDVLTNIFKNPFRFLKQKAQAAAGLAKKEEFWALKDVNFTVERGEVVGIIGANGAGKSTLLKILSQITTPTTGEVRINGRVGSLLEVGTGFHPELTGRENIFLNGSILGMTRAEIERKFDDIVAFSGIEKFLDTPVKYYSSGMNVRLGFAVAAHLEPDILIIDEVLAVGDAEFQKKCLGKMDEITKKDGRTILFVSHNMGAIEKLCQKTMLIEKGGIVAFGETSEVIKRYLQERKSSVFNAPADGNRDSIIERMEILDGSGLPRANFEYGEPMMISISASERTDKEFGITIRIKNEIGEIVGSGISIVSGPEKVFHGGDRILIKLKSLIFVEGQYTLDIIVNKWGMEHFENIWDSLTFNVINCVPNNFPFSIKISHDLGDIIIPDVSFEKD